MELVQINKQAQEVREGSGGGELKGIHLEHAVEEEREPWKLTICGLVQTTLCAICGVWQPK